MRIKNEGVTEINTSLLEILYPLLYPPAKKFGRIWEYFRQRLSVVLPLKNQVRALERKWAYSLGDHCERDALPTELYPRNNFRR